MSRTWEYRFERNRSDEALSKRLGELDAEGWAAVAFSMASPREYVVMLRRRLEDDQAVSAGQHRDNLQDWYDAYDDTAGSSGGAEDDTKDDS